MRSQHIHYALCKSGIRMSISIKANAFLEQSGKGYLSPLRLKRNKRLKWLYTYTMWMSSSSDDLMNSHNILHWEMVPVSCFLVGGVILRLVLDLWLSKWGKKKNTKNPIFPKCCYDKASYIKHTTQKSDSGLTGGRALRGGLDSTQGSPRTESLEIQSCMRCRWKTVTRIIWTARKRKWESFFSQLLLIIIRTESTQLTG